MRSWDRASQGAFRKKRDSLGQKGSRGENGLGTVDTYLLVAGLGRSPASRQDPPLWPTRGSKKTWGAGEEQVYHPSLSCFWWGLTTWCVLCCLHILLFCIRMCLDQPFGQVLSNPGSKLTIACCKDMDRRAKAMRQNRKGKERWKHVPGIILNSQITANSVYTIWRACRESYELKEALSCVNAPFRGVISQTDGRHPTELEEIKYPS